MTQKNQDIKAFADGVMQRAKNGPRAVVKELATGIFKDLPQDGVGFSKILKKPDEYSLQGIYDNKCKIQWLYADLGAK